MYWLHQVLSIQELKRRVPETDPRFKKLVEDASDVVEEEIGALTRLVDEFSQFAKLPDVVPELVDIKEAVDAAIRDLAMPTIVKVGGAA